MHEGVAVDNVDISEREPAFWNVEGVDAGSDQGKNVGGHKEAHSLKPRVVRGQEEGSQYGCHDAENELQTEHS